MEIANRMTAITGGESDGWDVFYKARQMKKAGISVTELTIGEHDIRTHPKILKEMNRSAKAGNTGYAPVPGTDQLREVIAQRIETRTLVPTTAANILITPGGQAALFAAHMAVLDPGDRALYLDPFYTTYPGTLRAAGAIDTPVLCVPKNNFEPTKNDLEMPAKYAKSLLVNSPNNPTGVLYQRNTWNGVTEVCIEQDLWLISDEVYDSQVWIGEHISPRSLPEMVERTLVIGSMSKSYAMTGSRIGWLCGPEKIIAGLIDLATHTTYGVPGYIQDAATFAIAQGEKLEMEIAAPFDRRRKIANKLVAKQSIVRAIPSSGAMYIMLDIRNTGLSGEEFASQLLFDKKIAVMPGESFGKAAKGHIRVAMTVQDSQFKKALKELLDFAYQKTIGG